MIGNKGYWKATGVDSEVKYNGQIVGYKMTLDFYEQNGVKSQWKMHEYRLDRKSSLPDANTSIENQEVSIIFTHLHNSRVVETATNV